MHHPTDRITHTTAFVTPVVEHWLEREILRDECMHAELDVTLRASAHIVMGHGIDPSW